MTKRKLPIGIRTFRTIREEGWYYVDKTAYSSPSAPTMPMPAPRNGCAPAGTG